MNGVLLLIINQRVDVIVPGIERLDVGKDQNESVQSFVALLQY